MLTVSKSGRCYIPGKPLSSDLRHIIDKIIDGGGNLLTMIFPGRFVNLVSVEHASVLACEPLLPSQPCIPVSTAGEANSKTLILMFLAPLSNKPFICKLKYFLDKSTASTVSSSFTVSRNKFILRRWRTSFTMRSTNLLYSRLISSSSTIYTGVILFVE